MIIKSIKIDNFQCYSGSNNFFEFTNGINVIIGDNATGKSKLYDAFNWVLFDECFETETRKFKRTIELRSKIVSDKAKHEAEVGDSVTTKVAITFFKNHSTGSKNTTLVRTYSIIKQEDGTWDDTNTSTIEAFEDDLVNPPRKLMDDPDTILARFLPPNIRPYTWFQGEQVDSLIDFENKKALTNAINVLSDISTYDNIISYAEKLANNVTQEYKKEFRRVDRKKEESDRLFNEIEALKISIAREEKELYELEQNCKSTKEKSDALLAHLSQAQEISGLSNKLTEIQTLQREKNNKLERLMYSINKSIFFDKWILRNLQGYIDTFESKYNVYNTEHATREAQAAQAETIHKIMAGRLPKGTPEPMHLRNMLKDETCLVCNRKAEKDSEAWLSIKELLDKALSEPTEYQKKRNDISASLKDLYSNALSIKKSNELIASDINDYLNKISELKAEIKELNEQEVDIKSKISDKTSLQINTENSSSIVNDYVLLANRNEEYMKQKSRLEYSLKDTKKRKEELDTDMSNIAANILPPVLIKKKEIVEDFSLIASSTRERVFKKLIRRLEEEANEHFMAMTKDNKGAKGRIKIVEKDGYYIPKNVGADGQEFTNVNDSDIILTKMAVILAIISAKSNSRTTQVYTLITDAPSSKFTDNYTIGFCNRVAEVYNQSIIMSKDFFLNDVLRERLLNGRDVKGVGNVYIIRPHIAGDSQFDRNLLSTSIEKIK